jgi:hypothetical protein
LPPRFGLPKPQKKNKCKESKTFLPLVSQQCLFFEFCGKESGATGKEGYALGSHSTLKDEQIRNPTIKKYKG